MTIPFPTVRVFKPEWVAGLVVFGVVVVLGALVVWQAYELRDLTAERDSGVRVLDRVERMCVRHPDGSAECKPRTWPVSK